MSGSKGQEIVNTWMESEDLTKADLARTVDAALRAAKIEGLKEALVFAEEFIVLSYVREAIASYIDELKREGEQHGFTKVY